MRKFTAIFLALVWLASLAGCGIGTVEQDIYRTDTVIYIPVEPTTVPTEPATETETETEAAAESETTEETVPETTKAAAKKASSSSGKKTSSSSSSSSSGKKPSSSSTSKKETDPTTAPTTAPTEAPAETETEPVEEETVPTEEATEEATGETTPPVETEPPLYDISGYAVGSLETAMMDAINGYRTAEGLGELSRDSWLCAIASARAYEASLSWSHTRPNGTSYATVFSDYGFGCGASAENLLYTSGGEDAAALVAKWMGSEGNRGNLMSADYTTSGIGAYYANGFTYIACLVTA